MVPVDDGAALVDGVTVMVEQMTVGTQVEMVIVLNRTLELEAGEDETAATLLMVEVELFEQCAELVITGYEVVEVTVLRAGQLVTVGAQDVMVISSVEQTVTSLAQMAVAKKAAAAKIEKRILNDIGYLVDGWGKVR